MESLLEDAPAKQERFCRLLEIIMTDLRSKCSLENLRDRRPMDALLDLVRSCPPQSLAIICHTALGPHKGQLEHRYIPLELKFIAPWLEEVNQAHIEVLFDYLCFWTDLGGWILAQSE